MRSSSSALRWFILCLSMLATVSAVSCGTKTEISKEWLSQRYRGGPMHKFLVIAVAETAQGRRTYEDRFVGALEAAGAEAVSSYEFLPDEDRITRAELLDLVSRENFDGVLVSQLLGVAKEKTVVQPSTTVVPSYRYGYYGYYSRGFDVVHSPGSSETTEIVRLETKLWNASDKYLAWEITSHTFDPTSTDDAISSVTSKLVWKLSKDGLLE